MWASTIGPLLVGPVDQKGHSERSRWSGILYSCTATDNTAQCWAYIAGAYNRWSTNMVNKSACGGVALYRMPAWMQKTACESELKIGIHPKILRYFSPVSEKDRANHTAAPVHHWDLDWPDFNSDDVECWCHTFVADSPILFRLCGKLSPAQQYFAFHWSNICFHFWWNFHLHFTYHTRNALENKRERFRYNNTWTFRSYFSIIDIININVE